MGIDAGYGIGSLKPGVCTSTTRPTNPFTGQTIYETDTLLAKVWTGSAWADYPPGKADLSYVNAQDATKLTASTAVTSNRNVVINGNMAVWQRGTTSTSTTDGFLVADRWYIYKSGGNTTVSQQTASLDGFAYSLRFQRVAGATATGTRALAHMFENTTTAILVNKTITLSFWAKCGANFSGTSSLLGWTLITGTGSTDVNFLTTGYTGQATTGSGSVTLTTSWQRFSASISVPSGKTQMGFYLSYAPTGTAGADDWFEVTGVQLEASSVATPFEFEDFGTTLNKCFRYYESGQSASFYQVVINGTWAPWTERLVHYKVRKRTTGVISVTVTNNDNSAAGNGTMPGSNVDGFTHRQAVNNTSFPYCAYTLAYTANAEL